MRNLHVIVGLGLLAIGASLGSAGAETLGIIEEVHAGALEMLRRHQQRRRISKNVGKAALAS